MSSQSLLLSARSLIRNQLSRQVPRKWTRPFAFGMQAYALRAFQSATGNARAVIANPNAAARRAERLLANHKLADHLGTVFDALGLVAPSSYINVDHSDMHGLTALVGAIQTRNGRAIPCLVETTYAHHIPAHEDASPYWQRLRTDMVAARQTQSFTGHVIDSLQNFHDRLGFWPKLVFDRGFGNESLIRHLVAERATFYVRLKAGRYVELDGQRRQVLHLAHVDTTVRLYGLTLRVIRSPRGRRWTEPWYVLTNDFQSSRKKVVQIYYHRFEIEETFRDMKHIWELKRTRLNKPNSLKILLWFVVLGIAVLYTVTKPEKREGTAPSALHPKKKISWLRQAQEAYQREIAQLVWQSP